MKRNVNVYLYIEGFEGNPEVFFNDFNPYVDKIVKKGIINPGQKRVSKFSYIKIFSTLDETKDLEKHIQSLLDKIKDNKQFKSDIHSNNYLSGINTAIYIDKGQTSPKCAMCLSSKILKKISDLNLDMDFDIYG